MNKVLLIIIAISLTSITNAQKHIKIDTTKSVVKWTGLGKV